VIMSSKDSSVAKPYATSRQSKETESLPNNVARS
jgi:hypothetical protein